MDGNGRWAKHHRVPRLEGHRAGFNNIRIVLKALAHYGIKYVTLYAFSTENWNRPEEEVQGLLEILWEYIHKETEELHKNNIKIIHLGKRDRLPQGLREAIDHSMHLTQHNDGLVLCGAFDYGGRAEILEAVRHIVKDKVPVEKITEDLFRQYLYTASIPDPDLIIRTGGELRMRLSNFLLWQSAYSELFVTHVLWPDFGSREIEEAINAYSRRQRRFGGLHPED